MPIEPVKIPQNVQMEDRLIGPITLRQVILCMLGGGLSYVFWNAMKASGLTSMVYFAAAWIPLVITAAFAFIKVQNLSLLRMILLLVERSEKPVIRKWGPRKGVHINIQAFYQTAGNEKLPKANTEVPETKLQKLSSLLDESVDIFDPESDKKQDHSNAESNRPVNPNRVQAEPLKSDKNIDDITPQQKSPQAPKTNAKMMQDISPPPHGGAV